MIEPILRDLSRSEYLHVILNPFPVYGTIAGLLGLSAALLIRNPLANIPPLLILLLSSLLVLPVAQLGEAAEPQMVSIVTPHGQEWLEEHEHRAERALPLFFATAALCVAAMVAAWKFPRFSTLAAGLVMLLAIAQILAGIWIGHAGGKITHREFQTTLPPAADHKD